MALPDMQIFAIASMGAYPAPTPSAATNEQRAVFAVSWGLLALAVSAALEGKGLGRLGFGFQMN